MAEDLSSQARRLVSYVVLRHDPAVQAATAGYWELSRPHFADIDAAVRDLVGADGPAVRAYEDLRTTPDEPAFHDALAGHLREKLRTSSDAHAVVAARLSRAEDGIWLDYHIGSRYVRGTSTLSLEQMTALVHARSAPRRAGSGTEPVDVHVVIPFRDTAGSGRTRNLLACLMALQDQDFAGTFRVTVVETDVAPRWCDLVEPLVDRYLYAYQSGLFNKSWTVNVGVMAGPAATYTCVLDADILTDDAFLSRNVGRLRELGHAAHVCCEWSLSLDESSTVAAIEARCGGEPAISTDVLRGVLLRAAPGGALWSLTEAFHGVGGFDERFEGWGGEDEDVTRRLAQHGEFRRFADSLLHLNHPRPEMRTADNEPFNAHLARPAWTGEKAYGDPERYLSTTATSNGRS